MPRQLAPLQGAAGIMVMCIFAMLVMATSAANSTAFCSTCTKENKPVCGLDGQVSYFAG